MIRSATVLAAGLLPAVAVAQDAPPDDEDPLAEHRTELDVLIERAIGTTSTPVQFNWRRTHVHLAATGSFLFELNNFDSMRGGMMVRLPAKKLLVELDLAVVGVWDTPSSEIIGLTPYRQPGRPPRGELGVGVAIPLAEGIVTTAPRFFPAVQQTFDLYLDLRYAIYPSAYGGKRPGELLTALLNPALTDSELDALERARLDGMRVDPMRYGLLVGFGDDLYFKPGLFVSPRMMFSLPLLAPASGTDLVWFADFTLSVGWAL